MAFSGSLLLVTEEKDLLSSASLFSLTWLCVHFLIITFTFVDCLSVYKILFRCFIKHYSDKFLKSSKEERICAQVSSPYSIRGNRFGQVLSIRKNKALSCSLIRSV